MHIYENTFSFSISILIYKICTCLINILFVPHSLPTHLNLSKIQQWYYWFIKVVQDLLLWAIKYKLKLSQTLKSGQTYISVWFLGVLWCVSQIWHFVPLNIQGGIGIMHLWGMMSSLSIYTVNLEIFKSALNSTYWSSSCNGPRIQGTFFSCEKKRKFFMEVFNHVWTVCLSKIMDVLQSIISITSTSFKGSTC